MNNSISEDFIQHELDIALDLQMAIIDILEFHAFFLKKVALDLWRSVRQENV